MPPPTLKTKVPVNAGDEQQVRQAIKGIREDLDRINLGIVNTTSGTPTDAPATNTMRFDPGTNKLWIYNGSAWKSTTLA